MSQALPQLRMNLDFIPSPIADRPGLLIRDTYGYSAATLIIPPVLVQALQCFDGEQTELDLRQMLVRITGDLDVGALVDHLKGALSEAGFLEDEVYAELRETRRAEFAAAPVRQPVHAGAAYPADRDEARRTLADYLTGGAASLDGNLIGIAAPHVSPFGGVESYRAAYSALGPEHRDRTFVILGTSHYGEHNRFGLTRKPFVTPYGEAQVDTGIVNLLADEPAAMMEDYCHSVEHSVEFQVLFLQHLYGPDIRIVPILCGSHGRSILHGGLPEDDENVQRFLDNLGGIATQRGRELLWVLGIDMAHMGRRYGDPFTAHADQGLMLDTAERDRKRIDRVTNGDARGFWELVQENQDDLKWCGSAPIYTFLRAVPQARGMLRGYQQWNIDEQSVVSFGALAFTM